MNRARQPKGVPTGGRFAAQTHAEVEISLTDVSVLDYHDTHRAVEALLQSCPGERPYGEEVDMEGTWHDPVLPVTVGVRDEDAIYAFKSGQCHALAFAIHERTGWPIVSVGPDECCYDEDCPDGNDSDGVCSCQIHHLAVRRPDGYLVDIEGPKPEEDFLQAQADPDSTVKEIPADRLDHIVQWDDTWRRPDLEVARAFVDAALTEYDPD